ncbi:hypothetical protein KKG71_01515 [Patescibacteria group bacterium]|nr:hypothetical protein [Patescibacteria group bacterium]
MKNSDSIVPYISATVDWREIVKGNHIILDTDAFISILKFGAENIFAEFNRLKTVVCLLHPVIIELRNTNSDT